MGWVQNVNCSRCGGSDWSVVDGVWTCRCGKQMTMVEVSKFHGRK